MPAVVLDHQHWAQLEQVQIEVNRAVVFAPDAQVWGRDEYWEPAGKSGDCEDIALTKRQKLIGLGWPADALRMAVLLDEHGRLHAVLTVDVTTPKGEPATYAMDNRLTHVEPWRRLNEVGYRWIEREKPGSAQWVILGG